MPRFIVNRQQQPNGDNEVHNETTGCDYMPLPQNREPLGEHNSCREAVALAKGRFSNARINGCFYCCRACHTT